MFKEKGKVYISEIISQEAEKFIKTMTVIEESEKPRIEEISAEGAIVGEIKPLAAIGEEISARKPRFGVFLDARPGAPAGWRATAGPREKGARPWGGGGHEAGEGPGGCLLPQGNPHMRERGRDRDCPTVVEGCRIKPIDKH